jgi:hypothetical protein
MTHGLTDPEIPFGDPQPPRRSWIPSVKVTSGFFVAAGMALGFLILEAQGINVPLVMVSALTSAVVLLAVYLIPE